MSSPVSWMGFIAAEGLLLGLKIEVVYGEWRGESCSIKSIWKDKKLYGISLIGVLLLGLLCLAVKKELVVIQFLDLLISYLLLSAIDIRTKKIPDTFLICMGVGQLLYRLCAVSVQGLFGECLIGFAVCVILLFVSVLTKGSMGMGDAKLLGLTAVFTGVGYLIQIIFWGMLCAFVFSVLLLVCKKGTKKTELPFVPFLMGGILVHMAVWVL